jgi:hypothetical protein
MARSPESSDPYALPPAQHQTTSIYDIHMIGRDRRPVFHTVVQGVIALKPLQKVPYYFNTSKVGQITAHRGCTLGERRSLPESDVHVADLVLAYQLDPGQRATLEYTTWFDYTEPPAPEYRRRVGSASMSVLDICVQFESGHEPARVWEANWPDVNPGSQPLPDSLIEVELEDSPMVPCLVETRRQDTEVQPGVVLGYRWEW